MVLVTLQRDPPLTRIFAPGARAPSSRTTERERLKRRAKIAVARPAAPAPTMATLHEGGSSDVRAEAYLAGTGASVSSAGTSECEPHAVQRRNFVFWSFDMPMISVRWLPHFGQSGDGRCAANRPGGV
jgi:hypothetical protein